MPSLLRFLAVALALLLARAAHADPGYYLLVPYDNAGKLGAEFRWWTAERRGRPKMTWPDLGASYGVNERWTTTLLASWLGREGQASKLSTVNWQNTVLLSPGDWPVDVAWHGQLTSEYQERDTTVEQGLLLQTELGFWRANFNLIFDRTLDAGSDPTALKLQWQLRRRIAQATHVGVLGFDELGPWRDFAPHARQSHRAGPMLDTAWHDDRGASVTLQGGVLFGKIYGRVGRMLTLRTAVTY